MLFAMLCSDFRFFKRRPLQPADSKRESEKTQCQFTETVQKGTDRRPVQAVFRLAKLKRDSCGYYRKHDAFHQNLSLTVKKGQLIVVDEDESGAASRQRWFPAFVQGMASDFWVNEDSVELIESSDSFAQLMAMFEECWKGDVYQKSGFMRHFSSLQSNLYSYYTGAKESKPSYTSSQRQEIVRELVRMFAERPADRNLRLQREGYESRYFKHSDLLGIQDFAEFDIYFLFLYGRLFSGSTAFNASQAILEEQTIPSRYDFYLNVPGNWLYTVVKDLLPLIDAPDAEGKTSVSHFIIAPLVNIHTRPDTIKLLVVSQDGFEKVKDFLTEYVRKHPDYFVDECLCLTERFAKGASWSQDSNFVNIWEMDSGLLALVNKFLDEVTIAISEHRVRRPFFDWRAGEWEEMERLNKKIQLRYVSGKAQSGLVDKTELRKLHDLSVKLTGKGVSWKVTSWMKHYKEYVEKLGRNRYSSTGIRMRILADLANKKEPSRYGAFRVFMKLCSENRVDLYSPHQNLPVEPYVEEGAVIVDKSDYEDLSSLASIKLSAAPVVSSELAKGQQSEASGISSFFGEKDKEVQSLELQPLNLWANISERDGGERQQLKAKIRKETEERIKKMSKTGE